MHVTDDSGEGASELPASHRKLLQVDRQRSDRSTDAFLQLREVLGDQLLIVLLDHLPQLRFFRRGVLGPHEPPLIPRHTTGFDLSFEVNVRKR